MMIACSIRQPQQTGDRPSKWILTRQGILLWFGSHRENPISISGLEGQPYPALALANRMHHAIEIRKAGQPLQPRVILHGRGAHEHLSGELTQECFEHRPQFSSWESGICVARGR